MGFIYTFVFMKQVFILEDGHIESWDDFVQRMIYIVNNCPTEREDWDFDDWTGGASGFVSKLDYQKGKEFFVYLKKEKLDFYKVK